ncbi:lysylphosphatidylglycerol synthase transmembrane domain-containing protein [Paraeggerthella hongkongensis]|uniref:lysylphosphatidylglycerol synthase transmembrane domain-containing protein n=1 Tax=Paraeggerthella hongkongensis TaxID=230658 RepID=UPI001FCE68F9|nr:lysylphosphatidylglycerol synthase transmembrane domain-containing protein [Paraeggerthella hongkongensis]
MKLNIRNLLIGLVIVIVLAVVLLRGDQLVELVETIKKGAAIPLIAALCTQLGKYFAQSFAYSYAFEAVDERMDPRSTLPLVFGTFFMNTIAPSLNLAGTTLVVDDARQRGIAPGKATSAALLMQITIDSGFATIMLIGFAILAATVGLSPLWFLLGLLVIALVGAMITILVLGRKRPALVLRVLRPIERLVNRILARFKKGPLDPWVERTVCSFSDAAGLIAHNPKTTAKSFGCSIAASACELACFSLVGVGFGVTVPEALICGYVVATLFAMISITPQGVGVVEAAVVVAFTSFGATAAAGLSIALVYRGIVFWMPFLIGAILIQTTKTFKRDAKQMLNDPDAAGRLSGVSAVARHLDEQRTPLDVDQPLRDRGDEQAAVPRSSAAPRDTKPPKAPRDS